jgi:hypothetical protein
MEMPQKAVAWNIQKGDGRRIIGQILGKQTARVATGVWNWFTI